MKKFKKVFAVILSLAMVLGMSMTALADETDATTTAGTIVVKGLTKGEATTVKAYKIIKWEDSSWKLVNKEVLSSHVDLTGNPVIYSDLDGIAIDSLTPIDPDQSSDPSTNGKVTFSNLEIGAYLIVATNPDGNTTYSRMVASTYRYDSNNLMELGGETVYAKAESYKLTKTFSVKDNTKPTVFIKRGETVNYDIEVPFPSFDKKTEAKDKTFTITDTPTGFDITGIQVYVGNTTTPLVKDTDYSLSSNLPGGEGNEVTVTFTEAYMVNADSHAGEKVKVVVTAVAGDPGTNGKYSNTANYSKGGTPGNPPTPVESETGSMTITKKNQSGDTLSGAIFNIKLENETLKFVYVNDGEYKLAKSNEAGSVADVQVSNAGKLVLKGLGAGEYTIEEKKAPDGYSINDEIGTKTISVETASGTDNAKNIAFDVVDPRLSSLPSTGGIGTTIFTIGGCAIMIIAAALFFASRRRAAK